MLLSHQWNTLCFQDVLCPATEERGDPSSIADVRGAHFAEFLREVLRDAMQHQVVPNTCALNHENRKGAPCALSDSVVIIATAEDVGNLHPVLAQPVLFGSSVFSFHLEFCKLLLHRLDNCWNTMFCCIIHGVVTVVQQWSLHFSCSFKWHPVPVLLICSRYFRAH